MRKRILCYIFSHFEKVWTYLKDSGYSYATDTSEVDHNVDIRLCFTIKGISKEFKVVLNSNKYSLCQDLFAEIENLTSIPQKSQALSYRQHSLHPKHPLCDYNFSDDNLIYLSVKGLGGGPSDDGNFMHSQYSMCNSIIIIIILIESSDNDDIKDECVSCGESANLYCQDCKTYRCKECNDLWHKHPKRKWHEVQV